jgi:hypothetical protein
VPIKVKEFKSKIRDEDAILIATPEYNYSVPVVIPKVAVKGTVYVPKGLCGEDTTLNNGG